MTEEKDKPGPDVAYIPSPDADIELREINNLDAGRVKEPSEPEQRSRWIEKSQEITRSVISLAFAASYLMMIIGVLIYFLATKGPAGIDKQSLQDISSLLLAPVATLVGTIMGFYFGSKSNSR